jgi:hypothetical protein
MVGRIAVVINALKKVSRIIPKFVNSLPCRPVIIGVIVGPSPHQRLQSRDRTASVLKAFRNVRLPFQTARWYQYEHTRSVIILIGPLFDIWTEPNYFLRSANDVIFLQCQLIVTLPPQSPPIYFLSFDLSMMKSTAAEPSNAAFITLSG